jgi:xylulokinase
VSLFLGLDIGTSDVKAIIVDAEDREQASAEAPLSIDRPQPLWSEQHPDAWWTAVPPCPTASRPTIRN